jgi:hypothetical protein
VYGLADNAETQSRDRGAGMMDFIVGALVVLILGSILLHIFRLGYSMYRLNEASAAISQELNDARQQAIKGNKKVSVIFETDQNVFGIDKNGNGKLERSEADDLPGGVQISEGAEISFLPSGSPPAKSKKPKITISNSKGSRNISVSSMGSVEIE